MSKINRRIFIGSTGVATASLFLAPEALQELSDDLFEAQLRTSLGLSKSNAQAMALRSKNLLEQSAILLVGEKNSKYLNISGTADKTWSWKLTGSGTSANMLSNAVAVGCFGAASRIKSTKTRFRWFSSCEFGGVTGHLMRHQHGALFLVTRTNNLKLNGFSLRLTIINNPH